MENGINKLKALITEEYGEKCPDFDQGCINCRIWQAVEELDQRAPDLTDEEADMALHWIDRYSVGFDDYPQLDRVRPLEEAD
ncbi:MAG: hypothetical protein M9944_12685 [Rhizobiaceae bacterium]|nr:hypothetical protein [Rhizobiaceae bacterium]